MGDADDSAVSTDGAAVVQNDSAGCDAPMTDGVASMNVDSVVIGSGPVASANDDGVVADSGSGSPTASQSILAVVTDPSSVLARPFVDVAAVPPKKLSPSAFQYTPPESFQDGQAVNTRLSFNFALDPVVVVLDEGDASQPTPAPSPPTPAPSPALSPASSLSLVGPLHGRSLRSFHHSPMVFKPEND